VLFQAGCNMAGNLLLLSSMIFYARHVILDAEGRLPPRPRKAGENPATVALPSETATWRKVDPPHSISQPSYQRLSATTPTSSAAPGTASTTTSPVCRKLTKAEKKALKERLLRERLERQQRLSQF